MCEENSIGCATRIRSRFPAAGMAACCIVLARFMRHGGKQHTFTIVASAVVGPGYEEAGLRQALLGPNLDSRLHFHGGDLVSEMDVMAAMLTKIYAISQTCSQAPAESPRSALNYIYI